MTDQREGKIIDAMAALCHSVASEPLFHFSEADLQSALYRELCSRLPKMHSTSVVKSGDGRGSTCFSTSPVHREYGAGGARRIDLAIFSPEQVKRINDNNLCETTTEGVDYICPDYAIELGTEKSANAAPHVMNDLQKLHDRSAKKGFIIYLYRDTCDVPRNTLSWDKRDELVITPYRQAIEAGAEVANGNVIILAFLLLLGRRDRSRVQRCQIFAPNGLPFNTQAVEGWKHWHWLNLNKVKDAVQHLCQ